MSSDSESEELGRAHGAAHILRVGRGLAQDSDSDKTTGRSHLSTKDPQSAGDSGLGGCLSHGDLPVTVMARPCPATCHYGQITQAPPPSQSGLRLRFIGGKMLLTAASHDDDRS